LLKRLHANKVELLMVLERPEIPLHTNGSENDIRCHAPARPGIRGQSAATIRGNVAIDMSGPGSAAR